MSKKILPLLRSMRLRTLPLSLAGVITGLGLAAHYHTVRPAVAAITLLTAALLQILSNLSNELGDFLSGTDTDGRTGPAVSNDVFSVTVVHPTSAMLADGLSTILFILGREKGEAFLRTHHPEAYAVWQMR